MTALVGFLSARYTARSSARAAERSAAAEEQAALAATRQVDVAEWQAILAELRRQLEVQQQEIGRVAALEGRYLAAIRYAHQVIRWVRHMLPDATPPDPPEVITEEF